MTIRFRRDEGLYIGHCFLPFFWNFKIWSMGFHSIRKDEDFKYKTQNFLIANLNCHLSNQIRQCILFINTSVSMIQTWIHLGQTRFRLKTSFSKVNCPFESVFQLLTIRYFQTYSSKTPFCDGLLNYRIGTFQKKYSGSSAWRNLHVILSECRELNIGQFTRGLSQKLYGMRCRIKIILFCRANLEK